ncbi:GNAT family N-acetyltransferase [Emticicia fluvialis]|uniref:GNAT family N-acetyltransferase n=1 Tax=Emticicia fluvialis TaxID=2974474 RepID=UPI00216615BE|nr:GNAT family N-acetyltransferase [Emticicia fluvialis]
MPFKVEKVTLGEILPYRHLFLQEINRQVRYNATHERRWSDAYLLYADHTMIGYASVKGQEIPDRDTLFEFYLLPMYQHLASRVFPYLLSASGVQYIETQSNALLLTTMLYEFAVNIHALVILFEDGPHANLPAPAGVTFQTRQSFEALYGKQTESDSGYVLEKAGEEVANGDFLLHYNKPFADLYMEVKESHRRQGLGAYLIQELKRVCHAAGKIPAARCNIENKASKATLLKGGLQVVGFMLIGEVKK